MASSTTKTRRNRQIAAETRLKFRPAEAKLAQQLRDAASELERGEATAHSVAETVRQAARQAIPQITKATSDQQGLAERLRGVAPALPADSPFAKAASVEQTGADTRLGEMRTQAITDFVKQQAQASAGEAFAVQNARNRFASERDRIGAAAADVAAQKGDYMAQRSGDFAESDLAAARSRAQQQRSFAHSDASREDSQAEARARAREKEDAAGDKETQAHARRLRKRESALQRTFVQKVAEIGTWTYEAKNPRDPSTNLVLPVDKEWVRKNRRQVETKLRAASGGKSGTTLSPEMARRVVDAFLRVGLGDPGSYKSYRPAKTVGGAVEQGAAGLPANPFG